MKTLHLKNVIIGGGLSGLSLAAGMQDATIISDNRLGGLVINTIQDGFSFDYGGHVYTTADHRVDALMRSIGTATYHLNRKAFFGIDNPVPFPVQDNASMLSLSVRGSYIKKADEVENFYEYCRLILGEEFTQKFMRPFNERVWCTEMEDMDFDWTKGRVKAPGESQNWGMNSSFWYATGHSITQKFAAKASEAGAKVIGGKVFTVSVEDHSLIVDSGGEFTKIKYEQLFDTSGMFNNQKTNMVISIGIGLNHKIDYDFHWTYLKFGQKVHRATLLSRYADGLTPRSNQDSLLLEVPFTKGMMLSPSLRRMLKAQSGSGISKTFAKAVLIEAGFKDASSFDITTVWTALTKGYPIPVIGHRNATIAAKKELLKHDVFLSGRWGAHGYYNIQHILDDAEATIKASEKSYFTPYLTGNFYYKDAK